MKNCFILFFGVISFSVMSQEVIQTNFYNLELPGLTSFERVNSTDEELANIDVFKIFNEENNQVKYLVYLMSNKLNVDAGSITESNLKDFLQDIGDYELLESRLLTKKDAKGYKLKLKLDSNIIGVVYFTYMNDILNRLFFMIPEKYFFNYSKEVDEMILKSSILKKRWDGNGLD